MKHLLTAIAAASFLTGSFIATAGNSDTDTPEQPQNRYYGDTLYLYDGKTVILDYFSTDDEDVTSMSKIYITTYADTVPLSSCLILGQRNLENDGYKLNLSVGIDTLRYDLRSLPDTIDPTRQLKLSGTVEHKYCKSFALNDSSFDCDFKFQGNLPANPPAWIKQFIATVMRNEISCVTVGKNCNAPLLKQYYSIIAKPKKEEGINAAALTPEEIAGHFAIEFERLYRGDWESDEPGPKYDYMFEVAPAWKSPDGQYVTYRFYTYDYTMGAHGYMEEFYITFDNATGRLLGIDDIIGKEAFPQVITLLDRKVTEFREKAIGQDLDEIFEASLSADETQSTTSSITKEKYRGKYYPRPAMTDKGVVFSYQPYEKGSFADGILHFLIPYSQVNVKIPY